MSEIGSAETIDSSVRSTSSQKLPGFIRYQMKPKPKKSDPVSRFQAHKAQWNRDEFLKRSADKTPIRDAGRWGGMVGPAPITATK